MRIKHVLFNEVDEHAEVLWILMGLVTDKHEVLAEKVEADVLSYF